MKVALLGSTHEVKKPWTGGSSELEQTRTKEEEKTGSESEPILETMLVRLEVKTTGVKSLGVLSSAEKRKKRLPDQTKVYPLPLGVKTT